MRSDTLTSPTMDAAFVTTLAFLLLSTLIGIVISQNAKHTKDGQEIKDSLSQIKVEQATANVQLTQVIRRVDDLHSWKNSVQERESKELRSTIEQMRREREEP